MYQLILHKNTEISLVLNFPKTCKLLVIQDLWNIQWLGFRKFLFGLNKYLENYLFIVRFPGKRFSRMSFNILFTFGLRKNLETTKSFGKRKVCTATLFYAWNYFTKLKPCKTQKDLEHILFGFLFSLKLDLLILFKKEKSWLWHTRKKEKISVFPERIWWAFIERKT